MSVETLLKLRDAIQMAADALNEELEKHAPAETKELEWIPEEIKWVQAEGKRGLYERYPDANQKAESTTDYKNMLTDLESHKGKLTREGRFYWLFSDNTTVGRKLRNK